MPKEPTNAIPNGRYSIIWSHNRVGLGAKHEEIMLPEPVVGLPGGVRPPVFTLERGDKGYIIKTEEGHPLDNVKGKLAALTVYIPDYKPLEWKLWEVTTTEPELDGQEAEHKVYTVAIEHPKYDAFWVLFRHKYQPYAQVQLEHPNWRPSLPGNAASDVVFRLVQLF